jgi:simple sugar transport system permease protein
MSTQGSPPLDPAGMTDMPARVDTPNSLGRLIAKFHLERRPEPKHIGLYRMCAVLLAIGISLLIMPLLGTVAAGDFYNYAWTGTFGTPLGLSNVLTIMIPLVIAGLAAAAPYRVGLWNVGIDGQILIGAWGATAVAFWLPDLPGAALIPLMIVAACIGGAVWILVPALARVLLGVSEIITTFLLNFLALAWITYWATGPWFDPSAGGGLRARSIPSQSELPLLNINGTFVHWGLIVAVLLPVAVWAFLRFTRSGYELTILRASDGAGRYAGINVKRKLIVAMLVGGAIGGLVGALEMMGTTHQLGSGLTNNTGFNALVIVVLADGSALGVLLMGLLFASLIAGGNAVAIAGVSSASVFVVIGVTLMMGAIGEAIARLRWVRTRELDAGSGGRG